MNNQEKAPTTEIKKYRYSIEFETIEQNVVVIAETITKTLEQNLSGSLVGVPLITFSTFEKEIPTCDNCVIAKPDVYCRDCGLSISGEGKPSKHKFKI
jgi:hypothetical protein